MHLHAWLAQTITIPRWFPATLVLGAGLFALAAGYIAGHAAGRR